MPDSIEAESVSLTHSLLSAGQAARERIFSFGVVYVGIFVFVILYIFSVRIVEFALDGHFQQLAYRAVNIESVDRSIALQIEERVHTYIDESKWVRWGGIKVTTLVLASDGVSWIYVNGHVIPQPEGLKPTDVLRQAIALLPATPDVTATVPHNSLLANAILVFYASILLQGLYLYNRATSRRHTRQLDVALQGRDQAANRAAQIEVELEQTRQRLVAVEPSQREHSEEIRTLQGERRSLQQKLSALAAREEELRGKADQAVELGQEVQALEDLLEEAGGDLQTKDEEIHELGKSLKRAVKSAPTASGSGKRGELLARRFRTLYKELEVDDRAIDDLMALRDESMKLKAEEKLKRLCDEADNVSVRRKVGGLPDQLSIFELGFAGKGRIYYTKGRQHRFRILAVGAKNSQDADLDYLRRLGRS